MAVKIKSASDNAVLHALEDAFSRGDVLALLQAMKYCQAGHAPFPDWAAEPMQTILGSILTDTAQGSVGKGNKPFGAYTKMFRRTVQASAYLYIREWQKDPRTYENMPRVTIEKWFAKDITWAPKGYLDAARYANDGLKSSPFACQSQTARKAAVGMNHPVAWGRREVEVELRLRGQRRLFGPPPGEVPVHVTALLSRYS